MELFLKQYTASYIHIHNIVASEHMMKAMHKNHKIMKHYVHILSYIATYILIHFSYVYSVSYKLLVAYIIAK